MGLKLVVDPVLNKAIALLVKEFNCHAGYFYGSRARGDFTPISDYDIMGVTNSKPKTPRSAPVVDGYTVDLKIVQPSFFETPKMDLTSLEDSQIILDVLGSAQELKNKALALMARCPPVPVERLNYNFEFVQSVVRRSVAKDLDWKFRAMSLVRPTIENYFMSQGKWFPGFKPAFIWLKAHDPKAYFIFSQLVENPFDIGAAEALADLLQEKGWAAAA